MQGREKDLLVVLVTEVRDTCSSDWQHVLVSQVCQEKVAEDELKETLNNLFHINEVRRWIDMLVAACWGTQKSDIVANSQVLGIFDSHIVSFLRNSKES